MTSIPSLFWGRSAYYSLGRNPEGWDRRYLLALRALPFVMLGIGTLLSQLQPFAHFGDRLVVIGLAVAAAVWVLFLYTSRWPQWQQPTGLMLVYFAGLLVFGWLLEAQSAFFLAFVIVGFLQAFVILPAGLAVIAVAATSCVVYLAPPGSGWRDPSAWLFLIFIVALQTALVSAGMFFGVRVMREQEKRKQMVAELEAALKENAGLHAQLVAQAREAGVLDERQRLAGEIHDTLAQGLTGIITQLEAAEQLRDDPGESQRHVEQAEKLARESLSEARRSVQALRPGQLEGTRLPEAIAQLAKDWSHTSGVPVRIETTGEAAPLSPELEVTLFRVAQEALANVAKHANAIRVGLTVSYLGDMVLLDVRDDGVGFNVSSESPPDAGANGQGYGLSAMRQRLRRVGGSLEVESAPGGGTAVSASVPMSGGSGG
jgi:signal transduction histidine kinase